MPDSFSSDCQVTRRSWLAEPSLSEELSSLLPPRPGSLPRGSLGGQPAALLQLYSTRSLTAGRSRLTRRLAAAPSGRRAPGRAAPWQRDWQPRGWGRQFPRGFHCAAVRMTGETRARTHKHTHAHTHTLAHAEPAGPGEGGGG